MRFDILTLFPAMCSAVLSESIMGRSIAAGLFEVGIHDIREYTTDKHRRVDDYPYGGGMGMIMQIQPIADCIRAVSSEREKKPKVIYLSPKGKKFDQKMAKAYAEAEEDLIFLCGHYEGIDQRVIDLFVDEEVSLGDFVLTGGELPAMTIVDAVARLLPGVLSADVCFEEESIHSGLLEYPQYTRPPVYEEAKVPEILLSGNHAKIADWRREQSLKETFLKRPDLLGAVEITPKEQYLLDSFMKEKP